ncbi:MAG: VapB-type antitoxin [Candidatus Freyarchaeota archaeon]|nr:VapB-type antitoxin [Candidatus Jordarchaeia archaeon]MBS7270742.1 VapB-type antitoxin [Candidatus Jordarchaeia archaeon]MBS7281395.1 VapB-type antitoxin [Candidatus Jordarchaeia archaeon]
MSDSTTVRVSKGTLEMLEHFKEALGAGSIDEVIKLLIKWHRKSILEKNIGLDRGKLKPFTEEDRGEDRG